MNVTRNNSNNKDKDCCARILLIDAMVIMIIITNQFVPKVYLSWQIYLEPDGSFS